MKLLWVMLGGALGSVLRYGVYELMARMHANAGLWGTLAVNILGSLVIGASFYLLEKGQLSPSVRLFLMVGVLGGFTTFSTFALESLNLFKSGETLLAILYIIGNNVGSILAAVGGYFLFKAMSV